MEEITNHETSNNEARGRKTLSAGICFVIRISSFVIASLFEISLFVIQNPVPLRGDR
jgi:hypothetical protein